MQRFLNSFWGWRGGILFFFWIGLNQAFAQNLNGFDIESPLIPKQEILKGGPPRDGIPAINRPKFVKAKKAVFLTSEDRVLGIEIDGEARAYPIKILNWHEIVNDSIKGQKISLTFCPLCGSGVAFDASKSEFGVSGLLYQSDVLLYDYKTESLWSQILGLAISGPSKGMELTMLPIQHTSWGSWFDQYPKTQVLSLDTGFHRDYSRNPYEGYIRSTQIMFPVTQQSVLDIHPKEQVLGVQVGDKFKAYPFSELAKNGTELVTDSLGGQKLEIFWDAKGNSARVMNKSVAKKSMVLFWFAWFGFHPNTQVYSAP